MLWTDHLSMYESRQTIEAGLPVTWKQMKMRLGALNHADRQSCTCEGRLAMDPFPHYVVYGLSTRVTRDSNRIFQATDMDTSSNVKRGFYVFWSTPREACDHQYYRSQHRPLVTAISEKCHVIRTVLALGRSDELSLQAEGYGKLPTTTARCLCRATQK